MAMFDDLTEAETRTLMRMMREAYTQSRKTGTRIKDMMPLYTGEQRDNVVKLLSARTGSLSGVRTDLTAICSDLLDHYRELERQ